MACSVSMSPTLEAFQCCSSRVRVLALRSICPLTYAALAAGISLPHESDDAGLGFSRCLVLPGCVRVELSLTVPIEGANPAVERTPGHGVVELPAQIGRASCRE